MNLAYGMGYNEFRGNEAMSNLIERVTSDPTVCHGKACIRGTRVMVSVVLDNLAAGLSVGDIVNEYPSLKAEDVQAAIAYGAELARERIVAVTHF
jgi:uncharacterized protein (DUF433 family)